MTADAYAALFTIPLFIFDDMPAPQPSELIPILMPASIEPQPEILVLFLRLAIQGCLSSHIATLSNTWQQDCGDTVMR